MTTIDGQTSVRLDPSAHARVRGQGRSGALRRSNLTGWLMIAPMVVLLAIFVIYPLVYSFYLSTFELSFYKDPTFVGLDFYGYVLDSPRFWNAMWVGVRLAIFIVPMSMLISFLLASFIRAVGGRLAAVLKTTIYIPTVISAVVASIIFIFMYRAQGGLINGLLSSFDVGPFAFLSDTDLVLPAMAVPAIWLGIGIATLIMLAGMLDIPEEYYEAASIDGASFLQKTRYITLPLLKNVLLFVLVTGAIAAIQQFELPLVMTNGGPVDASMTPNLYIFDQFRDPTPYARSFSLTASLLLFLVLGAITALIFRLVRSDKAVDG